MKILILATTLILSLSASAKALICDTEILSDSAKNSALAQGLKPVPEAKQTFFFDLNNKGNLLVTEQKVSSQYDHFSFGVKVVNEKIQSIWSMNLDGRVYDGIDGKNETSLEHLLESDGTSLKVSCRIK